MVSRFKLLASTLLCLAGAACGSGVEPEPSGGAAAPGPMPVTVARPLRHRTVQWDRYVGRFQATEEVSIRSRVSGYLRSIHFDEGEPVERGALLFVIDERPFELALARAKAERSEAGARQREAEASLEQAHAELAQAAAQVRLASSRLQRAEDAVAGNAIAQEEVEARRSEVDQAKASEAAARARIAAAEAAIGTAEALEGTAKARVDAAELDLSYCRIEAPISGRTSDHRVTAGNLVSAGPGNPTELTTIVATDPIHCRFDASEQEYLKYRRRQREDAARRQATTRHPVYAALVTDEGYPHRGHLDFLDSTLRAETGTIRVRAIFRNDQELLTPGLFAVVRLPGSRPREMVLVPDEAVMPDLTTRFVYVVPPAPTPADDSAGPVPRVPERVPVTTGPLVRGMRVIESGLQGDELVIVGGLMRIRPGATVIAQEQPLELGPAEDGLPDSYEPVPAGSAIRLPGRDGSGR